MASSFDSRELRYTFNTALFLQVLQVLHTGILSAVYSLENLPKCLTFFGSTIIAVHSTNLVKSTIKP